ncbi:MAG: class F sortase, partial [Candidatus Woesearchaeota archaeon]
GLGIRAVFGNLKNIKDGDEIYVEMEKGVKTRFAVVSISTYDFDAPTNEIFNQNDNSYLKLITCGGKWIPELRTHDKRIVVTAIKSDL